MKQLLSLLLCFVFLNVQTFAMHELPGGTTTMTGIYGGVLLPTSDSTTSGTSTSASNSLGLFAFVLPTNGFGAGSTLMFANGTVYNGTITAMGNPDTQKITAIIQATYNYNLTTLIPGATTVTTIAITATANGTMKANVSKDFALTTLSGNATIDISNGHYDSSGNPVIVEQTQYSVSGVKQSTSTSVTTTARVALP
jgi:hypothetical protein